MSSKMQRVLFIDDEENVLSALRRVFYKADFQADFTTDPDEAFRWVQEHRYAVVVSDQRMARLEGVEVLRKIREISPDTVRIMLTGYADFKSAMRAVNDGNVFRFLAKPWKEEDLKGAVSAGIEQVMLVEENRRLHSLTERQNKELTAFNEDLEKLVDERTAEVGRLNSELRAAFFSAIKIMGSLAGLLNPALSGHSLRVSRMAGNLARSLEMSEKEVFEVQVAAFLHNIGTLAPRKPGLSSEAQREADAKASAKVACLIPNIGSAALFIYHQLERFDGRGVPDGLKGKKIPLGARILSVCAHYDKLLYSGADKIQPSVDPLHVVQSLAGTFFDSDVVSVLEQHAEAFTKSQEAAVDQALGFLELRPGMVASRPIVSARGEVLVAGGVLLTSELIEKLWKRQLMEQPLGEIYVYRSLGRGNERVA